MFRGWTIRGVWGGVARGLVIGVCVATIVEGAAYHLSRSPSNEGGAGASDGSGGEVGLWIDRDRLMRLPTRGAAWAAMERVARQPAGTPDVSDQEDATNVRILAKALVAERKDDEALRREVRQACVAAIGTGRDGRTLALGREILAYVIAADLVGLPAASDKRFRDWLARAVVRRYPSGKTLRSTHEGRPNNWGTHAGAARVAIAMYLGRESEIERSAQVFRGWLGDRDAYAGFSFKKKDWWHADPDAPVGINPAGSTRRGHDIDGVLPDDMRRGGPFAWPPPKENYVYTALQGAVAQAILLDRAGYDVWEWEDRALLRAFRWLNEVAEYPAQGDDTWQPHVINYIYGTNYPAPVPARAGKNVGWTDWTHGPAAR